MSEKGKAEARRLLRFWSVEQRVLEDGRALIEVDVTGRPLEADLVDGYLPESVARHYEQHVAVRVNYACGSRNYFGEAHGGCGRSWSAAKLKGDPDPPIDPENRHAHCAKLHAEWCAECRAKTRK